MKYLVYFFVFSFMFGCTKGAKSPEGLIKMFAEDVATKKLDMDYYEKYTTGEMLEEMQNLEPDEFENNSRMAGVESVKVNILNKNCNGDKCILTYSVDYKTKNTDEGKFKSEVKKIAEVQKSEEFWKIVKVKNLKTYHESNNPINPLVDEAPKQE